MLEVENSHVLYILGDVRDLCQMPVGSLPTLAYFVATVTLSMYPTFDSYTGTFRSPFSNCTKT